MSASQQNKPRGKSASPLEKGLHAEFAKSHANERHPSAEAGPSELPLLENVSERLIPFQISEGFSERRAINKLNEVVQRIHDVHMMERKEEFGEDEEWSRIDIGDLIYEINKKFQTYGSNQQNIDRLSKKYAYLEEFCKHIKRFRTDDESWRGAQRIKINQEAAMIDKYMAGRTETSRNQGREIAGYCPDNNKTHQRRTR